MDIRDIPTADLKRELERREKLINDSKPKNKFGDEIIAEINHARKQFGDYTFGDKGPYEVMNIDKLVNTLNKLHIEFVASVLSFVLDNYPDEEFSQSAVECIIMGLEDRPDFDDLFKFDDRFEY